MIIYGQTLIKFTLKSNLYQNMVFIPQSSPNLAKFMEIINFGSPLDHVIKYTQYFPNWSLTETLTRSNSTNYKQLKNEF